MYNVPEQLLAFNKANIELAARIGGVALESAERLLELNIKTAKSVFADGVKSARAIAAVKDVQELTEAQTSAAQPAVEKAFAYSKSVYDVASQTQAELTQVVEEQVAEINKNVIAALDKLVKAGPAGSDVAVAAVKSAIAAANSAYDTVSKAAKQVQEFAEANVATATQAVTTKKKAA